MYRAKPYYIKKGITNKIIAKIYRYFRDLKRDRIRNSFIRKTPVFNIDPCLNYTVHTLLCSAHVKMAICTFKVFNTFTQRNNRYVIHDDGSLTEKDIKVLNDHFQGIKIIERKEGNNFAEQKLKNYPMILEYRKKQIMALKLVDVRLWGEGDRIMYLDSDILFFRKPIFLMQALANENKKNYFNKDIKNSYVQSPESIFSFLGEKPYEKINAGLWVMHKEDINFDKIEEWLNHNGFTKNLFDYTLDQTFISMLANISQNGIEYFPSDYDVDLHKKVEDSTSKHYVGLIRHGFELEGLTYLNSVFNTTE